MIDWLRKLGLAGQNPLVGAPAVRRQKTYSAQSGYVYQYYFEGRREAKRNTGMEYVFDVSADRKTSFQVSVFVNREAIAPWESRHGRELIAAERYAIAKMGLFQAFDERETPERMRQDVRLRATDVEEILDRLRID